MNDVPKLKKLDAIITWEEEIYTFASQHKETSLGVHLGTLLRAEPEPKYAPMDPISQQLLNGFQFKRTVYHRINGQLFDILHMAVTGTPNLAFVRKFQKTCDGRAAYLYIGTQARGLHVTSVWRVLSTQ